MNIPIQSRLKQEVTMVTTIRNTITTVQAIHIMKVTIMVEAITVTVMTTTGYLEAGPGRW